MEVSVIIPVYNEELNLPKIYDRLKGVMNTMQVSHEFIFINDGSHDKSMQLIKELAANDSSVRYINFSRNFGHQIAVTAGLDKSRGNAVAIIDADLQDPPELIIEMYAKMKEGYQVVYAKRRSRKGESAMKKWTAKVFYRLLARITSISIPVD
ncbi:MAG TPA: glycosyltransferase family 2 protein, partial [Bacteroidia bacterium]|nr:glycosyltransferase family 2 protein [Bacteroidia bacterium]